MGNSQIQNTYLQKKVSKEDEMKTTKILEIATMLGEE
jgi:hypothetical protein